MGERKIRGEAMQVRTPGGVVEVRWDERGTATAMGQLVRGTHRGSRDVWRANTTHR